jgi:hypothetical protein
VETLDAVQASAPVIFYVAEVRERVYPPGPIVD